MTLIVMDPPPLYCGEHTEHRAFVAIDVCGCIGGMSVIEHHEANAYSFAAAETRDGFRVETWSIARLREAEMTCPDHPDGPPWWQSRHVKGQRRVKRPTEWPVRDLGL